MSHDEPTIVAFRRRGAAAPTSHPHGLMEAVYAAGSLPVPADDLATKTAALMLQALGFLVVEEVCPDGSARALSRGEGRQAQRRPWRLLEPPFSGRPGVPDSSGAFV